MTIQPLRSDLKDLSRFSDGQEPVGFRRHRTTRGQKPGTHGSLNRGQRQEKCREVFERHGVRADEDLFKSLHKGLSTLP